MYNNAEVVQDSKKILATVKKKYLGLHWPGIYTYWRYWEDPRYLKMEKMLPDNGIIIDLGSGYGIFANFLAAMSPKRSVIAMEYNPKKVAIAKKGYSNVKFLADDITKAGVFKADAIILMHVLHHLGSYQEQEELLAKICAKLKKRGTLLIDEVSEQPSWKHYLGRLVDWLLYPFNPIFYRSRTEMINLLKGYSLKVIRVENIDGSFSPFAQIVYLCQKI